MTDKKVKITYEDYQRISLIIAGELKTAENAGDESLQQSEIVNKVLHKIVRDEGAGTSVEKAAETAKKIANCINHMITKEGVLMITQDSKVKNERLLCLNIDFDVSNIK